MTIEDFTGSWTPEEGATHCVQLTEDRSGQLMVDKPEPRSKGVHIVDGIEDLAEVPPEDPVRIKVTETNDGYDKACIIGLDCDQDIENAEVNDWDQVTDPNAERGRERRSNLME